MGSQWNKPMKFNEWWAIRSQALLELQLTPEEWFRLFAGQNIDTAGTPQLMLDTSGRVTEASAANIASYTLITANELVATLPLTTQATHSTASADLAASRHRLFPVAITIAAGGAVNNVVLHATLAGYKFHFKVLGLWMDVADATTTWFFHSTAGGVACVGCPATPGFNPVNITATYTMIDQLSGAYMSNSAVTGDVTLLDIAGVGAGAANGYIFLEGWFETT